MHGIHTVLCFSYVQLFFSIYYFNFPDNMTDYYTKEHYLMLIPISKLIVHFNYIQLKNL